MLQGDAKWAGKCKWCKQDPDEAQNRRMAGHMERREAWWKMEKHKQQTEMVTNVKRVMSRAANGEWKEWEASRANNAASPTSIKAGHITRPYQQK